MVLCLAMMFSIMVVGAGAAFADQDQIDTKHQEAVDACVALNIINGIDQDGKTIFKPNGEVTREQMAKMICVLLNGGKEPVLGNATANFTDVAADRWSAPYIASCVKQGIVAGVGGGKFNPAGNVTGTQAAKMLLVALGYSQDVEEYTGSNWAVNVNVDASARGFYTDLEDIDPNAALSREHAAEMIWNALNAYEVEYKNTLTTDPVTGQLVSQNTAQDRVDSALNKITLLEDKYQSTTRTGILTNVNLDSDDGTYTTQVVGTTAPIPTFDATKDYSEYMGQAVKVMYKFDAKTNENTLLGIYPTSDNKTVSAVADDADNITAGTTVTIDDTDYKVDATTKTVAPNGATFARADIQKYFNVTLIRNDKVDPYDYIVVEPVTVAQIDTLTSSKVVFSVLAGSLALKDGNSYNLEDDDIVLYDGAAEDDYVIICDSQYTVSGNVEVAKADVVSGEAASIKGPETQPTDVRVDGTWYTVANPAETGDKIKINDAYDFALVNGFAFNADKTKGNISADNVLYLDEAAALSSGLSAGVEAKVYFADGSSKNILITSITDDLGDDYDIVKTVTDTDEITSSDAANYLNYSGFKLYTFSEKNGEYSLEPVYYTNADENNIGSYDELVDATSATIKDGKAAGARFNADAVIFVEDNDGIKVVTGSTVNNWKEITADSVVGLADKSNGTNYIAIGAVDLGTGVAKTDARTYGFVTSAISTSKEGSDSYKNFTMWDGTQSVDVKVDASVNVAKYDFVAFDWADKDAGEADKDGFMTTTTTTDGADTATSMSSAAVAITAFVEGDSITFSDGNTYDFADENFVIGVDTNKGEGTTAKLAVAKDADKTLGTKYANAVYFVVKDGSDWVVEAVFVDVNGAMYTTKNGTEITT